MNSNYIGAAMTFVAGLAWNDAIKSTMEEYVKRPDEGLRGKYAYAVIVTMLTIIIIYAVSRLSATYKPTVPPRVLSLQTLDELKKLREDGRDKIIRITSPATTNK